MRVAAIYDVHGNLPALDAVLEEVHAAGVERLVIGGDVLPGPMPRETLARLMKLDMPVQFIRGNGDRAVLEHLRGVDSSLPEAVKPLVRHSAEALDADQQRELASWPETLSLEIEGIGEVLFCHATPRNDTDIFTRFTPEMRLTDAFHGVTARVVVCGHTHMQFDRTVGAMRVINAGSVGMPFSTPGAYWALLGPDVQLRTTAYDLDAAATTVRASDYPQADQFASNNILNPPSEQQMLEAFAQSELK
jgi:putative phosphoesterase